MNVEVWAKIAAICFGAVTAWSVIVGFLKGRKSQLREEYRFAREFVADLDGPAKQSLLLQQKGCHALTGDASVEFPALQYLLNLANPERAVRDYSLGSSYLEHVVTAQDSQIRFKRQFQSWRLRFALKSLCWLSYVVTYLLACSPLLLHAFKLWGPSSPFPALLVTACIFLPAAHFSIKAGIKLQRAERLVEAQGTRSDKSFKPNLLRRSANSGVR